MWTNTARVRQEQPTLAGLPIPTAVLYAFVFALAFWLYSTLWRHAPVTVSDSGGYFAVASDLADLRIDRLHYRPPGYPLLLLITGSTDAPSRELFYLSLLLHFVSIWILAAVLYAVGLTERTLALFGILLLLPPYVEPAAYVLAENLAECVLVVGFGSLVFWSRHRHTAWLLIAALAIGCAGLIRPTYQALAFAVAGSLCILPVLFGWSSDIRKNTLKASLVLIGASVVLVGGYAFLHFAKFDHIGLNLIAPVGSATLSTRTARVVERLPDEYAPIREALIRARDADLLRRGGPHTGYGYIANPGVIQELTSVTGLQGPDLARYLFRINLLLIREAPLQYLYDVSSAFSFYWFPSSTALANMNSRLLQMLWGFVQFCVVGIYAVTMVLVIGGLPHMLTYQRLLVGGDEALATELTLNQRQVAVYLVAGTIVMYTALLSSFLETGDPRYRVPTDGLIALMACLGTDASWRLVRCARVVVDKAKVVST